MNYQGLANSCLTPQFHFLWEKIMYIWDQELKKRLLGDFLDIDTKTWSKILLNNIFTTSIKLNP